MIICHQTNSTGFVAQKVLDDGTVAWDEDGNLICTSFYSPFYAEHLELKSDNKVISVWAKANPSGGSDNIYITRVDDAGSIGVTELKEKQIYVYPNPASKEVMVVLPESMKNAEVSIIDFEGKEVRRNIFLTKTDGNGLRIATADLASGTYLIRIKGENEIISQKLVVK